MRENAENLCKQVAAELDHVRNLEQDASRGYERRIAVLQAENELLARTNHELRDNYPLHRRADLEFGQKPR